MRSQCVAIAEDACYRIQYDTRSGRLYFSHLPKGEDLLTTPLYEESADEDQGGENDNLNVEEDESDADGRMDVDNEDEDIRKTKRIKLSLR